jgi:hypothetical protein
MTKTCGQCGLTKPLDEFTRAKATANFRATSVTHHVYCKPCNASRAREWRKAHPGYKGSGRISLVPPGDRLLMSAIRQRLRDAQQRCRKLKKPMPVLSDVYLYELYLKQKRSCALTGAPFTLTKNQPLSLSLDQIDPGLGYAEGNVQWVVWCVNRAKGDLPLDQFYEMCEVVLKYRKVQRLSKGGETRTE